jgi:phage shock protein E
MMKMFRSMLLPIVLVLAMLVSAAFGGEKDSEKGPIIIDVRTEAEWATGHVEGAVLIPYERIGEGIIQVTADRKSKIYLYCRSGRRSAIAADTLKKAGYENLINLESAENASKVLNRNIVK